MPVYLDQAIDTDGQAALAGLYVIVVVVKLTALGGLVTVTDAGSPDHVLRAGWVAIGDGIDIGDGVETFWDPPQWIDFVNARFAYDFDQNFVLNVRRANRIRWHLSPGTTAHLHVDGL